MVKNHLYYKNIFDSWMSEGQPVFNSKGEELKLEEGEEFRQCYDPDIPIRSVLPQSWFISNKENLISTYTGEAKWLLKELDPARRGTYRFNYNGRIKVLKSYTLMGIVFGAFRFGKADEIMNEKLVYAFYDGRRSIVNAHHPEGKEQNIVEFVDVPTHNMIHSAPGRDADPEKQFDFMVKLLDLMDTEVPGQNVILTTGDKKYIYTDTNENILFTPEAKDQLQALSSEIADVRKNLLDSIVTMLDGTR